MGSAFSSSSSYLQYKNDFELVIRATKDLEHLLETGFGAPSGKNVGLHDKITAAQASHGLSPGTVKQLRYLVTIRNRLVHDHGFNALPDRAHFARSYDGVERELTEKLRGNPADASFVEVELQSIWGDCDLSLMPKRCPFLQIERSFIIKRKGETSYVRDSNLMDGNEYPVRTEPHLLSSEHIDSHLSVEVMDRRGGNKTSKH